MKLSGYIAAVVMLLMLSGCATSGGGISTESSSSNRVMVNNPTYDLTDYLIKVSGVRVSGSGSNAIVTIHGINTINMNPYPLYVIDGVIAGRDFSRVYQKVNMYNVTSIDVLKGTDAARYGSMGANGVIEINYR